MPYYKRFLITRAFTDFLRHEAGSINMKKQKKYHLGNKREWKRCAGPREGTET